MLQQIIFIVGENVELGKIPRRVLKAALYLIAPALAVASVWPMIMEMPPLKVHENSNIFQFLMVIPWYLGILCSPLYTYVVLFNITKDQLNGIKLKLVDYSLKGAIISSILGLEAVLAIIPIPFVVLSIIVSILVFIEYQQKKKEPCQ